MKIAVGIIGLVLSMIALMQSCTITGLSGLAKNTQFGEAGAFGVLTSFLMFFGAAFSFGLPKVARVLFVLGFLASIPARKTFPDMWIWGVACLILGILLMLSRDARDRKPSKIELPHT